MKSRTYRLSYLPQYSDLLYLAVFLLGVSTIALLKNPLFIPLAWFIVFTILYRFIRHKPRIYFFDETIEMVTGIGKSKRTTVLSYSAIQKIQYCFAEIRGDHLFKINLVIGETVRTLQYSFSGCPSQFEVSFFEGKKITIEVIPQNATSKLYHTKTSKQDILTT
jgi:hypothetical protein